MSEIKVGEYVRTKKGFIGKLIEIDLNNNAYYLDCGQCVSPINIVNHSKKRIDLIKVGDIIQLNGEEGLKYEVLKISYTKSKGKHIHIINPFRTEGGKDIFIEDIKSIVTKEQFEKVMYKVGG